MHAVDGIIRPAEQRIIAQQPGAIEIAGIDLGAQRGVLRGFVTEAERVGAHRLRRFREARGFVAGAGGEGGGNTQRHCEEAKPTKQSMGEARLKMDCFAALAMTVVYFQVLYSVIFLTTEDLSPTWPKPGIFASIS